MAAFRAHVRPATLTRVRREAGVEQVGVAVAPFNFVFEAR
jgi:hypothetical protein